MTEEVLEDRFSSDEELIDNDSDTSTDVDALVAEDEVFDAEFLKCYAALKKKDEKIYDKNVKFFENECSSSSDSEQEPDEKKRLKGPRMTLLDHQLNLKEEDIADEELEFQPKRDLNDKVSKSFYEKELEEIKRGIEKISENVDSDSDEDLFIVKGAKSGETSNKPKKPINVLLDKIENQDESEIAHLKELWNDPEQLSEEDKFLRDYVLHKRYIPEKESSGNPFFSKNIDDLSDAETEDIDHKKPHQVKLRSEEKDFDKISRIPRNSTKTIRDLVEKQQKKEKRLKKVGKEVKKKRALKDADCEDIIADMPTKFHYRETEPNDYGLSAEELLMATDEELEQWAKLSQTIAYKTPELEAAEKKRYESMRNDIELKKKIFKSLYCELNDLDNKVVDGEESSQGKTKTRDLTKIDDECHNQPEDDGNIAGKSNKRKKKHKRGLNHKKFAKVGVAPDRLLAYGLSKTKLKKSKLL